MTAISTEDLFHPDEYAQMRFSIAMRTKMLKCRKLGRSGWDDPERCSIDYLRKLLFNEMAKEHADVVDIANYCMMLHQRGVTHV